MKDLAIIVPYRNREEHLKQFIPHLKKYLDRKNLSYDIYIIEQEEGKLWNKGSVYNSGFKIVTSKNNYKNYCFHDVDLLPISVDYSYSEVPTHISSEVEQLGWRYPPIINGFEYPDIFGGIILFTKEHYEKINGFSNQYLGWGAEDDDLLVRVRKSGLKENRRLPGATKSLKHDRPIEKENYIRNIQLLNDLKAGKKDYNHEGLNTISYEILEDKSTEDYFMYKIRI